MEGSGKMYYGIREVAEKFKVNPSQLRFYETEFPTLKPKKNQAGDRTYTQADIDHLAEILDLTKRQKFTIPGAREFLKEREERRRENARYINKLKKIKSFLEEMRAGLDKPAEK